MCGWKGGEHGARAGPHRCTAPGAPRLPASLPSSCPQVILAMLWLAASESQPPGCQDCAMLRGRRVPVQPPITPQRRAARPPCPAGMNWIEGVRRCCAQCPAGTFLLSHCSSLSNNSVCATCPPGTFRAQPNTFPKCQACYECDHQAFQSVLSNCSATSNVACGCKPGHFRDCLDERCSDFSCRQCQPCTGRLIQRPCSEAQDALCGSCKPDFYAEGGECRPCHMLGAGVRPAGAHRTPLPGRPCHLPQEEAAPARCPGRQPPPCDTRSHPHGRGCGHTVVPGQCPGVGQPVLDQAVLLPGDGVCHRHGEAEPRVPGLTAGAAWRCGTAGWRGGALCRSGAPQHPAAGQPALRCHRRGASAALEGVHAGAGAAGGGDRVGGAGGGPHP
ncbi:tumor necrosis factor receptor superfamily member 25 isoform 3-T3 [Spheniscus humboldti]